MTLKLNNMRLSAVQSNNVKVITDALKNLNPVFQNYKDGTISIKVNAIVSTEIQGFELLSCNPFNGNFVAKFKTL